MYRLNYLLTAFSVCWFRCYLHPYPAPPTSCIYFGDLIASHSVEQYFYLLDCVALRNWLQ